MKNLGPYELNSIVTGECADVMSNLPDNCIDLTVTSPPYDNLRDYNGYVFEFETIAEQLYRVTKPGGVVVWVVGDATIDGSETLTSFKQALYFREIGFNAHDTMIWKKISPYQHKNRYINAIEYMFIFSKGPRSDCNLIKDRLNKWSRTRIHGTERQKNGQVKPLSIKQKSKSVRKYGARYNIWDMPPEKNNTSGHPAPFPEALARDHIISWSNPGDLVLDPMCGSGTTLKMATELGRQCFGIDISQEYCDLSQRRVDGARVPLPGLDEPMPEPMPEPVQSTFAD